MFNPITKKDARLFDEIVLAICACGGANGHNKKTGESIPNIVTRDEMNAMAIGISLCKEILDGEIKDTDPLEITAKTVGVYASLKLKELGKLDEGGPADRDGTDD